MNHEKPYRRIWRVCFFILAWLFAAFVILQVLFAGLALFTKSDYWLVHFAFARYLAVLPLIMAIVARGAHLPAKIIRRCLVSFGMIIGLFLTAVLSSRIGVLSALHPAIPLLLFRSSAATIGFKAVRALEDK